MAKDDDTIPFSLRLPRKLLMAIAEVANTERRSTNSEIVRAVERHLEERNAKVSS